MPGLLDAFTNMNPDQAQGLLSAAAQMLERSGDPTRNYGLGQAMGTGIGAYQQATQAARLRKQQEEEAAQVAAYRTQQTEGLKQEQQINAAKAQRATGVQDLTRQFYASQGQPVRQAAAIAQMSGPTMANANMLAQLQPAPQPSRYEQGLQLADELRANGYSAEADAATKQALEFRPQVKGWEKVTVGGKVMFAPFFEDGTNGQPVPLEVAEKLHFGDDGQNLLGMDQYTGAVKSATGKKQSLESIASNNVTMRGQNMADARARELNSTTRELGMQEKQLRIGELEAKAEDRKLTKQNGFAGIRANIGVIDKALAHPGRTTSTGLSGTLDPRNYVPGTDATDFRVVADQIGGGAFLQAFESIKGAGQITEIEGTKATNAIARLNRAQSDGEYQTALKDLREVMNSGLQRAGQAPVPLPVTPGAQAAMEQMPTANASNKGRVLRDDSSGKRFRSNGLQWVEIK